MCPVWDVKVANDEDKDHGSLLRSFGPTGLEDAFRHGIGWWNDVTD